VTATARPIATIYVPTRRPEIHRHWPLFRATARRLRTRFPDLAVILAVTPGQTYRLDGEPMVTADTLRALAAADAALCKSGTATIEAAVAGTPMVIAYQLHPVTFAIARRLVRVPFIGLPNLVAGRRVVPEFETPWLRELELPPFRIVYRRDEAVVTVVRVWRSERLMDPDLAGNA